MKKIQIVMFNVLRSLMFLLFCFSSSAAHIGLSDGFYSVNATVNGNETSISSFGSYRVSLMQEITPYFSLNLGYSLLLENINGGDTSYGFDLGVNYFPISLNSDETTRVGNVDIKIIQKWSPFVGIGFYQRQYQSIQSGYSGFGLNGGAIYAYKKRFDLFGEIRYVMLNGPVSAKATEISPVVGVLVKF